MLEFDSKLFFVSNIWMHAAVPIFAIVMFFCVLRGKRIRIKQIVLIVAYPLLYLVFAYILLVTSGAYVYPFFNPTAMKSGYGVVLVLAVIAVLLVGLAIAYSFGWNKRMTKRIVKNEIEQSEEEQSKEVISV